MVCASAEIPKVPAVLVDAHWVRHPKTRCSGSGEIFTKLDVLLKGWAKTPPTVSLRTAEATFSRKVVLMELPGQFFEKLSRKKTASFRSMASSSAGSISKR